MFAFVALWTAMGQGDVRATALGLDRGAEWRDGRAYYTHEGRGEGRARLKGFRIQVPLGAWGEDDVRVRAPGPWWPKSYLRPGLPMGELRERTVELHSAPDGGFGAIFLTRPDGRTLGLWLETAGNVNYHLRLKPKERIAEFDEHMAVWLPEGNTLGGSPLHRDEYETLDAAYAAYRKLTERRMPRDPGTPAWVRDAVVLEAYPPYYGGFNGLREKLPYYRDHGINTVYLMPHWKGGYMPVDPFEVDTAFGTADDLKALVAEAKRLGMRFLFDMVIHGMSPESPWLQKRPDLFQRDGKGGFTRHPTWRSVNTDWAKPEYQGFMADLARHDAREYGIDGYRVDAAGYKGANWDPESPYPAYASGSEAPAVMRAMLKALRETNPDAVLLSEVFGPVFYGPCDFAHDNQTEAAPYFLEEYDAGWVDAADYAEHLKATRALLPEGANRVYYTRNHDASWFYRFGGYTPRFFCLEAVHAFVGIPEVFSGDPKHGPNPDDAVWAKWREIFAAREAEPLWREGALTVNLDAPNRACFFATREKGGQRVAILVNFGEEAVSPPEGWTWSRTENGQVPAYGWSEGRPR